MVKNLALIAVITAAVPSAAEPTYSKEVSRLLRERCESCHREGGSAPFALSSYEDVKSRTRSIRGAVESASCHRGNRSLARMSFAIPLP